MLSACGVCMAANIARCTSVWGKFREHIPLLAARALSNKGLSILFKCCKQLRPVPCPLMCITSYVVLNDPAMNQMIGWAIRALDSLPKSVGSDPCM